MNRKPMDGQYIEEHLKNAVTHLRVSADTVEEADKLWQVPVERATGKEYYLRGTASYTGPANEDGTYSDWDYEQKPKSGVQRFLRFGVYRTALAAAAVVLVFLGLSYYQFLVRIDSTIYLDVNPSVTLSVNRVGKVLGVEANNADAAAVLKEIDIKGKDTEDAVEEILSAMKTGGYLPDKDNTVLVSLECASASRATPMAADLTDEVEEYLKEKASGGAVFCQTVEIDDDMREFAQEHSVSAGKAALIMHLVQEHPELDKDQLASLSMSDLVRYLHSQNIDLRDTLGYAGDDLDDRWQREDAAEAAEKAGEASGGAAVDGQAADHIDDDDDDDADDDADDADDDDSDDDQDTDDDPDDDSDDGIEELDSEEEIEEWIDSLEDADDDSEDYHEEESDDDEDTDDEEE